jgi:hypothetical protein
MGWGSQNDSRVMITTVSATTGGLAANVIMSLLQQDVHQAHDHDARRLGLGWSLSLRG